MAFNQAAVLALFEAITDEARLLGVFARVTGHEPKSAPGLQLSCAFWLADLRPLPVASGLNKISGLVTFGGRIYRSFLGANATEDDAIDPAALTAASSLIAAYSGGFTLGETVRNVDLLGQFGAPLSLQAGYTDQDGKKFRVLDLTIPVVINDLWTEAP